MILPQFQFLKQILVLSKNVKWIILFETETFEKVSKGLTTGAVARLFDQPTQEVKRFEIVDLNVVKFSFPRPVVQGHRCDRDMHGAQWAVLLAEHELGKH